MEPNRKLRVCPFCEDASFGVVQMETKRKPHFLLVSHFKVLTQHPLWPLQVALSFFDASLWPSLSSIPAITYSYKSLVPVVKVMRVLRPIEP